MQAFGIAFIVWSVLVILAAPLLIRRLYGGKFANLQPWLFGFEGYLPIDQIESLIFGPTNTVTVLDKILSNSINRGKILKQRVEI
jgi:hypothetical protein